MPMPLRPPHSLDKFNPLVARLWGYIHRALIPISRRYCAWAGIEMEGAMYPLPFNLFLKTSDRITDLEANAMIFARSIGLPVPRLWSFGIHDANPANHIAYSTSILMTFVPGPSLGEAIYSGSLSSSEQETIISELRACLAIMRSIQSPWGNRICSLTGGKLWSPRVPLHRVGPCEDEKEFNASLISAASSIGLNQPFDEVFAKARRMDELSHKIVFTHGDLQHHNIHVHNGHISGIIDWECAGWYPEYWDCTTPLRYIPSHLWWYKFVQQLWENKYLQELEYEQALWLLTCNSFW